MARTTRRTTRAYPFAVVRTAKGFSAGGLQFASVATAETREELLDHLQEQVGLYLLDCDLEERAPDGAQRRGELDLRDYHEEGIEPEVIYVDPAPLSAASVAIERAVREEGVSYAELARRMNTSRSVVTRITNPFYFGHTSRTLRSVAEALGREVHVSLDKPSAPRPNAEAGRPTPFW